MTSKNKIKMEDDLKKIKNERRPKKKWKTTSKKIKKWKTTSKKKGRRPQSQFFKINLNWL